MPSFMHIVYCQYNICLADFEIKYIYQNIFFLSNHQKYNYSSRNAKYGNNFTRQPFHTPLFKCVVGIDILLAQLNSHHDGCAVDWRALRGGADELRASERERSRILAAWSKYISVNSFFVLLNESLTKTANLTSNKRIEQGRIANQCYEGYHVQALSSSSSSLRIIRSWHRKGLKIIADDLKSLFQYLDSWL